MALIPFPNFAGKDSTPFSSKADSQKLINLYRERIQSGDGQVNAQGLRTSTAYCLIKTPGMRRAIQPSGGAGVSRGSLELNDHVFTVVDSTIYDLVFDVGGVPYSVHASYGPIANDGLPVVMSVDATTLCVVSAGVLYRVFGGALSTPATPVAPTCVVNLRNYWVIVGPPTLDQVVFFSTDKGATWPALNFQSAEGAPSSIITMIVDHEQLWALGNRVTQIFDIGSDLNTPLVPRMDAVIEHGIAAARSLCATDDALFWLEKNKNGEDLVVRASGYQPQEVSTYAVSNTLRQLARTSDAIGMAHRVNGHKMIRFTFPSGDTTLELDATENDWHQVATWDATLGIYHRHRGNTMVSAFRKILVGDMANGWLYEMSPDFYDDDTANTEVQATIRWFRQTSHIVANGNRISIGELRLFGETGVGLAVNALAPGWNPMVNIRFSFNGANTWSSVFSRSLGKLGQFLKYLQWNSIGAGPDPIFQFYGSDPVKIVLTGAAFEAEVLNS